MTPTGLTDALGMYTYGGGGYHCIHMEDGDFEIFKKRQLTAVTNPASNLKLASGIAPIKRYLDEGIALAIGTDGPASNNCLDMFQGNVPYNSTCQGKGAGCGLCPGRRGTLYGNGGRRAVYGTGGLR